MSNGRVRFRIRDHPAAVFRIDSGDAVKLKLGAPVIHRPGYTGPYEVTPGPEAQVLQTAGRGLTRDITVAAIPQNYGLITYNGRVITGS